MDHSIANALRTCKRLSPSKAHQQTRCLFSHSQMSESNKPMSALCRKHPEVCRVETCKNLREIKQIHCHMLIKGLLNNPVFLGQYVSTIALKHPNHINYSIQILDQCANPTLVALNTMIRTHCKSSNPQKSFHFYQRILDSNHNLRPDHNTFTFLVRACAQLLVQETGLAVLGSVIKYGFDQDPNVQSSLVYMFSELGLVGCSRKVFMEMCEPNLVAQTAMLSACAKSGDLGLARDLFDKMPHRDSVAWNAMLAGYVQCGKSRETLELFYAMQMEGVWVNEVSIVSVLSACTQLGLLDQGRLAHSYVDRFNLRMTVTLGSALVDMYAKCGDVNKALQVFWDMKEKNIFTWTSAMGGLAMNGYGKKCLELFSMMKHEGLEPNEVTFVSVLKGCSVAGLVEEGQNHFESMKTVYGIEPTIEHYGCVVDLYARAGRLDESLNIINSMPMKPHAGAWGALLNACKIYKNTELGELASRKMVELEEHNHGAYVQLSNIYADSKNWERVDDIRQTMQSRGITKVPGWSVVDSS